MGLPGSGKTYLAKRLSKKLNYQHLNADIIRKKYNDWDFSLTGRIRQAKRMNSLANKIIKKKDSKGVVVDFICPTRHSFKFFKADFIIWMNTIKKSRFENINQIFTKPNYYDCEVTYKNTKFWLKIILGLISNYKWSNKEKTGQMLGRFQPWHFGHYSLLLKILEQVPQVNIQIKDMHTNKKNPFTFKQVKKFIENSTKSFGKRIRISKAPNIDAIFYGRKVGYKIRKIELPLLIQKISATKVRQKLFKKKLLN